VSDYTRICITIPVKMKEQIDNYNEQNPYEKINVSQLCQGAIYNKMKMISEKASNC
jgi:hypothetical protein